MAKYKVSGPFSVLDNAPGATFSQVPDGVNVEALLASGAITAVTGEEGDDKPAKVPCPACVEQELKQPPKFDDLKQLQKHYADKHPALVAPETMPAAPEKEE